MTGQLPAWLKADDVDTDRLLIAGWLWFTGDAEAALGIATAGTPGQPSGTVVAQLEEIATRIGNHAECSDDPQRYAWMTYGQEGSGGRGWDAWAERECEDIAADVRCAARLAVERARAAVAA